MATATINTGKASVVLHSVDEVLRACAASTITMEQAADAIDQLKGKGGGGGKITFKVSRKGALSVYGLGRMPVTLYASQWERLFGEVENLKAYIASDPSSDHAEDTERKLPAAKGVKLDRKTS